MEFFRKQTNFDFIGQRRLAAILSAVLILASIGALLIKGLNLGLDFTGGTLVELSYPAAVDLNEIRGILEGTEFEGAIVQNYGTARDVLVRLPPVENLNSAQIGNEVMDLLRGEGRQVEMQRIEFVGAQVGEELTESGGLAMLFALLGILIYVAIRFQSRFALGAIAALVHDVIFTFGFFSITGMSFDLTALAAILTVIGYSLNDTIVVFDRIRENFHRMRNATPTEVFNSSLNQTLSRTIMTGLTTMLVLTALFFLGGATLQVFSAVLIVGILIGTYSSIYVAGTITLALGVSRRDLLPVEKEGAQLPDRP